MLTGMSRRFRIRRFISAFCIFKYRHQQFCKFIYIVCPEDQIHETIAFLNFLNHGFFLHHTAAQGDLKMRVLFFQTV